MAGRMALRMAVGPMGLLVALASLLPGAERDVASLATEVSSKGWLVFAAHPLEIAQGREIADKAQRGQADLYLARPDGSQLRNITNTPEFTEYGGRFSPDGRRLLYFRVPRNQPLNHDLWGEAGELVLSAADGSQPVVCGAEREFAWASWSPDGRRLACLYKKEGKIRLYDVATRKPTRELSSQGLYQQLGWSPDGKRLCGTGNVAGRQWNVMSIDLDSERRTVLSRGGAGSCTPDWFQNDPRRVIYSHRINGITPRLGDAVNNYGFTVLMQATSDGKKRSLVYGKLLRHVYFACTSPDGKYVVFADDPHDTMLAGDLHLLRLTDAPIVAPQPPFPELQELYPNAKEGPVLDLLLGTGGPLRGFEPHWTYAEVRPK